MKTWILVAESSRARLYEWDGKRSSPLRELADLVRPQARLHEREITADLPGRNAGADDVSHHALADPTPADEQEAIRFAREVVEHLEQGRKTGAFDRLFISAAPAFLGHLRKAMSEPLQAKVARELDKNLVQLQGGELKAYFMAS